MKKLILTILALALSIPAFAVFYDVRNYCEDEGISKHWTQTVVNPSAKHADCGAHTTRDFTVRVVIDVARGIRSYMENNLSVTFVGAETKTALTQEIPGGSIGANGSMIVRVDCKQGTGNPSLKVKFGGVEIATITTTGNLSTKTRFWNQGAENDNFYNYEYNAFGGYLFLPSAGGTDTTIDTSIDRDVTVELTSTGSGTTIVRGVKIVVYYKP